MIINKNNIVGFVLNLLTIISNSFGCLVSIFMFTCIIYYQFKNRMKREERIILILSANIYLFLFIYDIVQLLLSISTLLGDLYDDSFALPWCVFHGYLISTLVCAVYYGFIVQVIIDRLFC